MTSAAYTGAWDESCAPVLMRRVTASKKHLNTLIAYEKVVGCSHLFRTVYPVFRWIHNHLYGMQLCLCAHPMPRNHLCTTKLSDHTCICKMA